MSSRFRGDSNERPRTRSKAIPPFVLLALGCLLLFTGCVSLDNMSGKPPTPPSVGVTDQPVTFQALRMFDTMNGWATTFDGAQVLHTSRGVLHWQDVSPKRFARSNSQSVRLDAAYFMDVMRAWVIFNRDLTSGPLAQQELFVERTTDGGQISFLTPQIGWLLLSEGAALGSEGVEVLQTTEGGATWYPQPLPLPGTFPPSTPSSHADTRPLLTFNGREGVFPVDLGLPDGRVIPELYRTHDGGHTWQATAVLPAWPDVITFLNPQDGWTAGVHQHTLLLYRTFDGGHTWKPSTHALPPGVARIIELNFVAKLTGWMISETKGGHAALLFQTTDGGQTWREVQPLLDGLHALQREGQGRESNTMVSRWKGIVWQPDVPSGENMSSPLYSYTILHYGVADPGPI